MDEKTHSCVSFLESPFESEDCLHLNVYTPTKAIGKDTLLPVMFWIFGGGFVIGDPYLHEKVRGTDMYDGLQLASRHDVVIVTANYRLNMLGWRGRHTVDGGVSLWDVFGFEKVIR